MPTQGTGPEKGKNNAVVHKFAFDKSPNRPYNFKYNIH